MNSAQMHLPVPFQARTKGKMAALTQAQFVQRGCPFSRWSQSRNARKHSALPALSTPLLHASAFQFELGDSKLRVVRGNCLLKSTFRIPRLAFVRSKQTVQHEKKPHRHALATEVEYGGNDGGGKKGTGLGDGGGGGGGGGGGDHGGGPGDFGPGFGEGGFEGEGPKKPLSLWEQYLALLDSNPLLTKGATSAFLNFVGDLMCQTVIEKKKELDFKRLGVISLIGLVLVGPSLHFWYGLLNRIVTIPGGAGIVSQLVLDQFAFSPVFIAAFFSALLTLEGRPGLIQSTLQKEWASTCIANWKIWIPFQFLNFWLVPVPLRVGAANVIALLWTVYLSFVTHK